MPPVNRPLNEGTAHHRTARRLENQERATRKPARSKEEERLPFTMSGDVTVGVWPPLPVRVGGQSIELVIGAGTSSVATSTFRMLVNGSVVGSTVTLPAGTSLPGVSLYIGNVRVAPGSMAQLEAVTVGAGLADLGASWVLRG